MENYTTTFKKYFKTLPREKQEQLVNDNKALEKLEGIILNPRTRRRERLETQAYLKGINQLEKELYNQKRQAIKQEQLVNESNNHKVINNTYDYDLDKWNYWLESSNLFKNRDKFKALKEKSILSPSYIQKYHTEHKEQQAIYLKKWKEQNKDKVAKHNKDYYLRSKQLYNIDYLIIPNTNLRHKRTIKSILKKERDFRKQKEQETRQEIIKEVLTKKGEQERKIINLLNDL